MCQNGSDRPRSKRTCGAPLSLQGHPTEGEWACRPIGAGWGYPAARRDGRRPASLVTRRSVWRRVGGEVGAGPRTGPQRAASGQRQGNALGPRRLGSPCPDEFVRRAWGRSRGAKGSAAASQLERLGGPRAAGCPREGEGSRTAKRGALTKTALQPQRRGNEHRRLKSALPPEGHEHRQCTEGLALSPASSDGEGSCAAARAGGCSHRLLEFEHELVDRLAARRLDREVARILGVAPEIAFGDEFESGGLDFAAQRAFLVFPARRRWVP